MPDVLLRRMCVAILAIAFSVIGTRAEAQWRPALDPRFDVRQETPGDVPSLGASRVAGQILGGTLATPIGFVVGGLATRKAARLVGFGDDMASRLAHVGGWTGAALATAAVPPLAGRQKGIEGSYPAAIGGAVVGGLLSWGIVKLFDDDGENADFSCNALCTVAGIAVFVLPSVGATTAWNASRQRR